jgi:hypothetical protein
MMTIRKIVPAVAVLLCGFTLTAVRPASAAQAAPPAEQTNMTIDVRNGDQQGKLMLKDTELAFESLTDARHSRTWKYTEVREVSRRRKELVIRPFHGDRYQFQFKNKEARDRIYGLVSDRVVAARQAGK